LEYSQRREIVAGLLDLSGAQESSFDPIPPGKYVCEVHSLEMVETKGGEGAKLPAGTPMIKARLTIISTSDGETEVVEDDGTTWQLEGMNRTTFSNLPIPPSDYDPKKAQAMKNTIFTFFKALGVSEDELHSKKGYDPDLEAFEGVRLICTLGRDLKYGSNPVKGYKALEEGVTSGLL
jgi:hypothetical protein